MKEAIIKEKGETIVSDNISLRDHFATQAMIALVKQGLVIADEISIYAYEIADAMIKEREN